MENWISITHVKSSLEPNKNQFAMFIGRWQPLHDGHKELFNRAFSAGKKVLVCVRDGQVNEKNPFTPDQVIENFNEAFSTLIQTGMMQVIKIPDIQSIEFGRAVGYDIIEHIPPTEIGDISATKIREQMSNKEA